MSEGNRVDPSIQLEINKGNEKVVKEVRKDLSRVVKDLKEFFTILVNPVEKQVEENKKSIGSIETRVGNLEQRQSKDEGAHTGRREMATSMKVTIGIVLSIVSMFAGWGISLLF